MKHASILFLLTSGAMACGGVQTPSAALIDAKSDVKAAETVNADEHPKSRLYLKLAREKIAKAEELIQDERNEYAAYVLEQAEADAELAVMLAKEQSASQEAEEARDRIRNLRLELSDEG